MLQLVTIALGTEEQPYTKSIEAEVFGDWCVHGIFRKSDPTDTPSQFDFTVSHVNTGRRLRTGYWPYDLSVSLAKALHELGPIPTWDIAKKNRKLILALVDAAHIKNDRRNEAETTKAGAL